jgi:hypothetical protein
MYEVRNLKNLQIEERPGETTAGLTSASQLVNTTDAVSFEFSNTCSDIPEPINATLGSSQRSGSIYPKEIFKQALRRSMRRENKILDALAKY